ncbi:MAG TPA: EamA family transporter [Xanthobacteraceae bacterium]|nr:EamA family transporter [Xanthobacteraceae bacterium]
MKPRSLEDIVVVAAPAVFVVLWSSGFIGTKVGVLHAEPMTFLSLRTGLLVLLLGALVLLSRPAWPSRARTLHNVVAGLCVHGLYLGGVTVSMDQGLPAGLAALIVALQPILTSTLANRWLGERVALHQWIGLVLGLAGVWLVVQERTGGGGTLGAWIGIFIALIGITAGTLYQKRFAGGVDWRIGLLVQYAASGALFLAGALALETWAVRWTPEFVLALGWLVFGLSLGAIWLFYFMIRRSAAMRVTSLFYLTPPVTALMAWLIFDERLSPLALVGMAICVAGVFLVNWNGRWRRR